MEPKAIVKVAWGDTTEQPRPQFAFLCSAAPMLPDMQEVGLRGGQQGSLAGHGEACAFLASFDGEWENLVATGAVSAFRPARPLDTGEHTLRVRAVDGRGARPPPHPHPPFLSCASLPWVRQRSVRRPSRADARLLHAGYVQITPTLFRFMVDSPDEGPAHREIRSATPKAGAAGSSAAQEIDRAVDARDTATHAAIAMHDSAVGDALISSGDVGHGWQGNVSEGEVDLPGGQHGTAALVESP